MAVAVVKWVISAFGGRSCGKIPGLEGQEKLERNDCTKRKD